MEQTDLETRPKLIEPQTKRVVISGAGPAGLLVASLLLARNTEQKTVKYEVTLVDFREDYGSFTKEELQKNHRSWMLGLAHHGMDAIKTLPNLYENYCKEEGVTVPYGDIYIGATKFSGESMIEDELVENKVVDRNFIVAALARYVKDTHENNENFTAMYNTKCLYVDYENKKLLVRDKQSGVETYIPYDLLIGADGIRSTVREAMIKCHPDFACDVSDIFCNFKAVHVKKPETIPNNILIILANQFPKMNGILLPETGDKSNISLGYFRSNEKMVPQEMLSTDKKVVSDYVRENFKAFQLEDYDDFADQWVKQRWNQTGQVHCNFYHSLKAGVILMGDAAHATSPAIGMGMNTALRDAQVFYEILKEYNDDMEEVLPQYSKARVKEGNSLTDAAFHLSCIDEGQQFKEVIHMIVRSKLHTWFPSLVDEHPQVMIGRRGVALSDVYERAVKQNIIPKHRQINDRIQQEYFEEQTGMVKSHKQGSMCKKICIFACVAAVGAFVYFSYIKV